VYSLFYTYAVDANFVKNKKLNGSLDITTVKWLEELVLVQLWRLVASHLANGTAYSLLCIVQIKTYRGHYWKGKEIKILEKEKLKKTAMMIPFGIFKLEIVFRC